MHLGEGKNRVSRDFWRAKIASHAIFGGVEIHIMHLKIHIMHLADQNVRFTNPGCQSKKLGDENAW